MAPIDKVCTVAGFVLVRPLGAGRSSLIFRGLICGTRFFSGMQMSGRSTIEVIPAARRLVRSLRDMGYDFVQAVADLVDNSIAAGAKTIDITIRFDGNNSWLRLADNGCGMNGKTITEAMRYGADTRDYESDDLGKFGLGLKTASMSQCRKLTVASRIDRDTKRIEARQFDLDHIEAANRWEIFILGPADRSEILVAPLLQHTGTVVLWEKLDRVLDYHDPWGERARKGLLALAQRLEEHLAMVFHRFITGDARKLGTRSKKVALTLNGAPIEAWDPFARSETATQVLDPVHLPAHMSGHSGTVRYQPYILPTEKKFSSKAAHDRAGGPNRWNSQQGFYIYRADRMIQSGGWCRMRTADEHTKLARVALDFDPDLDEAFEISVNKTRVKLSTELRDQLKQHVGRLATLAKNVYSRKEGAAVSTMGGGNSTAGTTQGGAAAVVSTDQSGARPGQVSSTTPNGSPAPRSNRAVTPRYRRALETAAAQVSATEALERIVSAVQRSHPDVARELGW